jgi:hypothetical protein
VEGGSCRGRRKLPWREDPQRLLAEKLAAVVLQAAEGSLESSNRPNGLVSTRTRTIRRWMWIVSVDKAPIALQAVGGSTEVVG